MMIICLDASPTEPAMSPTHRRGELGRGGDECSTEEQATGENYDLWVRHR